MQELKDTQSEADTRNISIDRVGVKGLRFPIQIQDKLNRIQSTVATVSLAVDLPEEFKGTHMSRFVEALHQHGPLLDVHTALAIPRELLRRLSARRSHVEMEFPFFRSKNAPVTGIEGLMDYVVRFEMEAEGETPDIALGVCDPDMNVALDAALRQYGWGLHNPEGKPFAGSGVMDLLRNLQRALEEKGTARPVYSLARSSLLCASLGIRNQQSCCAALDKIQQKYLPETEEYLLSRLKEAYPEAFPSIQAILEWRNRMAGPDQRQNQIQENLHSHAGG